MEFFKCSIGGEIYRTGITEIEKGGAERAGVRIDDDEVSTTSLSSWPPPLPESRRNRRRPWRGGGG